jgi:hypothetical protein
MHGQRIRDRTRVLWTQIGGDCVRQNRAATVYIIVILVVVIAGVMLLSGQL